MNTRLKNSIKWIFGWIKGENAWMLAGLFLTLIWFVVDWCMSTTFRPMSLPQLYLVNFTAALLLLLPWMLTRSRIVGLMVQSILSLILEANLIYCRTYYSAIPPEGYLLVSNMKDFTDSIWPNLRYTDLGFVVIFILMAIFPLSSKLIPNKGKSGGRFLGSYTVLICLSALVSYAYILCIGGFYKAYDVLIQGCKTFSSGVPTYTIAGHLLYKFMDDKRSQNPDSDDLKAVDDWMQFHCERFTPNECRKQRKNIVMVICESLESWPIGLKIDGKEITPFLNSLVADTSTFYAPNVLTQVGVGRSIDGQLIYITGLLPTINSVYSMKYPDRTYPSLNKILKKDRDAKSILMTTDNPITWNMLAIEKAFGYDTILCHEDWIKEEMIGAKHSDGSFIRQSIAKLKKGEIWPENTPAMLTFITCSGHSPFKLPSKLKNPDFDISDKGFPKILEDYITMTHYVDSQLGTIIEYINGRSDKDDTMIMILGDHEGLGKNRTSILESSDFARKNVGDRRYTPLIVVNSPVGCRFNGVIGQVDIFPTILDMMGVDSERWRGVGVSALDESRPNVAFSMTPPANEGEAVDTPVEVIDHIKSASLVSEMIIIHDLYGKKLQSPD